MYDATTYPPTVTTSPPPTSTASTGAPTSVGWMVPAIIVLVVLGAVALRIATRKRRFMD